MKNLFTLKLFKTSLLLLAIVFAASKAAFADGRSIAEINAALSRNMANYQNKIVVGGDFSLDFVAAAPLTYNHQTGGGAYDDRTIGKSNDVVESLEGGDFQCYDMVSYLTKITVSPTAVGSQTIELDYSFLAAATGQPGVALSEITYVGVNYGPVSGGDGPGGIDSGMDDDLESVATLLGNPGGTVNGTLFVKPATLTGTVQVTDLEAGEVVIVRVDVMIDCQLPSSPTGNLQASLPAARVTFPVFTGKNRTISVGQQTVPFKNVNLIGRGTCSLGNPFSICEDQVATFTVNNLPADIANAVYSWSVDPPANATFVQSTGAPLPVPNSPGSVPTVYAIGPAAGTYTVSVEVTSSNYSTVTCSVVVTVNDELDEPADTYNAPACDATTFSVTITNVVANATYSILDKCGDPISGVMVGLNQVSSYTPTTTANFSFSNIPAGAGYQITAAKDGCTSPAASCGTCPDPVRKAAPTKPIIGTAEAKDLIAYPVPFSESVTVEFKAKKAENYVINLYDLQGHLVRELKAGNAKAGEVIKVQVSGAGMAESMYLVRKVSKNGTSTVKLLKKE